MYSQMISTQTVLGQGLRLLATDPVWCFKTIQKVCQQEKPKWVISICILVGLHGLHHHRQVEQAKGRLYLDTCIPPDLECV